MSRQSQLTEALRRGDIVTYERLAARNDRPCDLIRGAVGVAAAVVFILAVLLTANVALGSTPVPAVGQLAAWSTDTVPSVSVPSPIRVATPPPPGVPGGDGGGQASGVDRVRSTGTPAPESSPSDPPPQSGPDDGEGQPEAAVSSPAAPAPPLDEIWTCGNTTAGVATWLNAHTDYDDLTSDPDCVRGGPDPAGDGLSKDGSGPPPNTGLTCDQSAQLAGWCDTVGESFTPPDDVPQATIPTTTTTPGEPKPEACDATGWPIAGLHFPNVLYRHPDGHIVYENCEPVEVPS